MSASEDEGRSSVRLRSPSTVQYVTQPPLFVSLLFPSPFPRLSRPAYPSGPSDTTLPLRPVRPRRSEKTPEVRLSSSVSPSSVLSPRGSYRSPRPQFTTGRLYFPVSGTHTPWTTLSCRTLDCHRGLFSCGVLILSYLYDLVPFDLRGVRSYQSNRKVRLVSSLS